MDKAMGMILFFSVLFQGVKCPFTLFTSINPPNGYLGIYNYVPRGTAGITLSKPVAVVQSGMPYLHNCSEEAMSSLMSSKKAWIPYVDLVATTILKGCPRSKEFSWSSCFRKKYALYCWTNNYIAFWIWHLAVSQVFINIICLCPQSCRHSFIFPSICCTSPLLPLTVLIFKDASSNGTTWHYH